MKLKTAVVLAIVSGCAGLAIGRYVAGLRHDRQAAVSRCKNYTDRARICLEAAAILRSKQPDLARKYLEKRGLDALRGVPMGRRYEDLSADSQALMVTAKLYDAKFDDVDFRIDQLTGGDVPDNHPKLSIMLRSVTGKFGG